jgi:hypothetical protein
MLRDEIRQALSVNDLDGSARTLPHVPQRTEGSLCFLEDTVSWPRSGVRFILLVSRVSEKLVANGQAIPGGKDQAKGLDLRGGLRYQTVPEVKIP